MKRGSNSSTTYSSTFVVSFSVQENPVDPFFCARRENSRHLKPKSRASRIEYHGTHTHTHRERDRGRDPLSCLGEGAGVRAPARARIKKSVDARCLLLVVANKTGTVEDCSRRVPWLPRVLPSLRSLSYLRGAVFLETSYVIRPSRCTLFRVLSLAEGAWSCERKI